MSLLFNKSNHYEGRDGVTSIYADCSVHTHDLISPHSSLEARASVVIIYFCLRTAFYRKKWSKALT